MSRWFRFYDGALDDPKVQRLPPELFKVWVNLLCLASRNGGDLPCLADMSFALRLSDAEMDAHVVALTRVGLLDQYEERFRPHNWDGRQHKSDDSAERVRRYRSKHKGNNDGNGDGNGGVTVTVTPPETDTETETDPVATATARPAALSPTDRVWSELVQPLTDLSGKPEAKVRGWLGKALAIYSPESVLTAGAAAIAAGTGDPFPYMQRVMRPKAGRGPPGKSETVQSAAQALEEWTKGHDQPEPRRSLLTAVSR